MRGLKRISWWAPAASLCLLGVLLARQLTYPTPEDAAPYHERVRKAAEEVPYRVGNWIGTDVEVIAAATKLLRPNVIVNRSFINRKTGQQASLLIVHCQDARDLAGHYPPRCYPSHGWEQMSAEPWSCQAESRDIDGTRYTFTIVRSGQPTSIIVSNFMVLPDGRIVPTMDEVYHAASDYLKRFYGAAQVQVLVDRETTDQAERDRIAQTLIEAASPMIEAMASGIEP